MEPRKDGAEDFVRVIGAFHGIGEDKMAALVDNSVNLLKHPGAIAAEEQGILGPNDIRNVHPRRVFPRSCPR
uniref:Uncharacterized protein n=1 Tax=Candidatus Kentrum sp. LFY TaxID=2126342 RepID=A0A450UH29_9GAMM|nr:MAG: hypothetical protein BECKLFY1418B_GA0070995_10298 [Candidatus Kentron sp. LFY]VFJ98636.1 MAG: hypothetical protein BECKLFY1418A_GA0070994_10868 [Candidatus Kentron sp. LFY]